MITGTLILVAVLLGYGMAVGCSLVATFGLASASPEFVARDLELATEGRGNAAEAGPGADRPSAVALLEGGRDQGEAVCKIEISWPPLLWLKMRSNRADKTALRAGEGRRRQALRQP